MSAWIVSKEHIDHLVTGILTAELSDKTPDELGRMLWAECLASVAARYPHDGDGERPGPVGFRDNDVKTYTWARTKLLTDGELDKTVACYEYQSCEHYGWRDSEAMRLCNELRNGLARRNGGESPDWPDTAPWGW